MNITSSVEDYIAVYVLKYILKEKRHMSPEYIKRLWQKNAYFKQNFGYFRQDSSSNEPPRPNGNMMS